jgi:hypothetical protein
MLSRYKFRLINNSLFITLFDDSPCIIKDRFQNFIYSSRDLINKCIENSIIQTNRNGCGNSSNINDGSTAKSVCSFNSPCRDGIGIDCSLSIIRFLEKSEKYKFNQSMKSHKLCRRIFKFCTTLSTTHYL